MLVPKTAARKLEHPPDGLEVLGARTLREALEMALVAAPAAEERVREPDSRVVE